MDTLSLVLFVYSLHSPIRTVSFSYEFLSNEKCSRLFGNEGGFGGATPEKIGHAVGHVRKKKNNR